MILDQFILSVVENSHTANTYSYSQFDNLFYNNKLLPCWANVNFLFKLEFEKKQEKMRIHKRVIKICGRISNFMKNEFPPNYEIVSEFSSS